MTVPRSFPRILALELAMAWGSMLVGTLLPDLIAEFRLSLGQAGLAGTIQNLAALAATLAAGALCRRLGSGRLLLAGAFMLAIVPMAIAAAGTPGILFCGVALLGLGTGAIDPMTNVELSRIAAENRGRYLSLLHFTYSVGAIAIPLVAAGAASLCGWRGPVYLGMVFSLSAGIWFGLGQDGGPPPAAREQNRSGRALWRDPLAWIMAPAMFLYAGVYKNLAVWIVTYLEKEFRLSHTAAALGLSLLFASVTLGRLLAVRLERSVSRTGLLLCYALGGAAATILLPAGGPGPVLCGIALFGLATGGIYPIATAFGMERYPDRAGPIAGLIYGAGTCGGIVLPVLTGRIADASGMRTGISVCTLAMAAAALAFIALFWQQRRHTAIKGGF